MSLRYSFLLMILCLSLFAENEKEPAEINIFKLKPIDKSETFKTGQGDKAIYMNGGLVIGLSVTAKKDGEFSTHAIASPLSPRKKDIVSHSYFDADNLTIYEVGFRKLEGDKSEQILTIYDASSTTHLPERLSVVIPTDQVVFSKFIRKGNEIRITTLVGLKKEDKTFVFEITKGENGKRKLELKK